jgi:hypothetical protein
VKVGGEGCDVVLPIRLSSLDGSKNSIRGLMPTETVPFQ